MSTLDQPSRKKPDPLLLRAQNLSAKRGKKTIKDVISLMENLNVVDRLQFLMDCCEIQIALLQYFETEGFDIQRGLSTFIDQNETT